MNNNHETIIRLIEKSYSINESLKWDSYEVTSQDKNYIVTRGQEILENFPYIPKCCAPMSSMWAALIRDNTNIPAHVVAGCLNFKGKKLFGNDLKTDKIQDVFFNSNSSWDGHCWVMFGHLIGEISLFRTAYKEKQHVWLKRMVIESFGKGRGMLLATLSDAEKLGLQYQPQYILTDDQITGLELGARDICTRYYENCNQEQN